MFVEVEVFKKRWFLLDVRSRLWSPISLKSKCVCGFLVFVEVDILEKHWCLLDVQVCGAQQVTTSFSFYRCLVFVKVEILKKH